MHSKIIQLENSPVISPIDEYDFLEGFVGWIADYTARVDEDVRKICIEIFCNEVMAEFGDYVSVDKDTITFKQGYEQAYQDKRVKDILEVLNAGNPYKTIRWQLIELINDPFGYYISHEGSLYTYQSWLNCCRDEETFYFGGVVDYHF